MKTTTLWLTLWALLLTWGTVNLFWSGSLKWISLAGVAASLWLIVIYEKVSDLREKRGTNLTKTEHSSTRQRES